MNEEDIKELKRLLYSDRLTQYGKRKLIGYYEQRIEELEEDYTSVYLKGIYDERDKKDKIIDLMIKVMIDSGICDYFIKQNCKHYAGENKKLCDVCIKEYFEKKAEEDK